MSEGNEVELTYAKSKNDLEEIADLRGKVFARRSYFELYDERKKYQTDDPWYKPEHSRIIKENGRIVSHVSIIEKPVRFGPAIVKLAGIGDVLTHPNLRGNGYSRILMEDSLHYMKENNYPLTMLYGIPNYYHKFGYIESIKNYKLFLTVEKIDKQESNFQTRKWQTSDVPQMLKLYKENCENSILTVDRNEVYLKRIICESKRIILILENDEIVGYAQVFDDIAKRFVVNEAITSGYEISKALAFEIQKKAPRSSPNIEVRMSPQMPFVQHLQHMGTEMFVKSHGEGEGNAMLAIIDLYLLMNDLISLFNKRLQSSEFYNSNLYVALATEKEKLNISIEQGVVQKIEKTNSNDHYSLEVNHRYFVRNIVGYWTIQELLSLTDVKVGNKKSLRLFDVLFPKQEPFMLPLDYF